MARTDAKTTNVKVRTMDEWLAEVAALPKADLSGVNTVELVRAQDAARMGTIARSEWLSRRRSGSRA